MGVVILYDEYLAPRLHGDLVPYFSSDIVHNTRLHIYYIIGNILIGDRSTDQSCFSLQISLYSATILHMQKNWPRIYPNHADFRHSQGFFLYM